MDVIREEHRCVYFTTEKYCYEVHSLIGLGCMVFY